MLQNYFINNFELDLSKLTMILYISYFYYKIKPILFKIKNFDFIIKYINYIFLINN